MPLLLPLLLLLQPAHVRDERLAPVELDDEELAAVVLAQGGQDPTLERVVVRDEGADIGEDVVDWGRERELAGFEGE